MVSSLLIYFPHFMHDHDHSSIPLQQYNHDRMNIDEEENEKDQEQMNSMHSSSTNYQAAISNPLGLNSSVFLKLCRFLSDCLIHRSNECFHALPSFFYCVRLLGSTLGSMCHILLHTTLKKSILEFDLIHCIRSFSRLIEDIGSKSQATRFYVPSLMVDLICKFKVFQKFFLSKLIIYFRYFTTLLYFSKTTK